MQEQGGRPGNRNSISGEGKKLLSPLKLRVRIYGQASLLLNKYRRFFPRKRHQSGPEADHSRPSSAEVKNAWSCTSAAPYAWIAWCLFKHTDNLPFICSGIIYLRSFHSIVKEVQFLASQQPVSSNKMASEINFHNRTKTAFVRLQISCVTLLLL